MADSDREAIQKLSSRIDALEKANLTARVERLEKTPQIKLLRAQGQTKATADEIRVDVKFSERVDMVAMEGIGRDSEIVYATRVERVDANTFAVFFTKHASGPSVDPLTGISTPGSPIEWWPLVTMIGFQVNAPSVAVDHY